MDIVNTFLKQNDVQSLLDREDLDTIFAMWIKNVGTNYRPLIKFFHSISINPLEYLTKIPIGYFYYDDATTSVAIPDNIKELRQSSFFRCKELKEVHMTTSVKSIENEAFYYCDKLEKIIFDGTKREFLKIRFGAPIVGNTNAVPVLCKDGVLNILLD